MASSTWSADSSTWSGNSYIWNNSTYQVTATMTQIALIAMIATVAPAFVVVPSVAAIVIATQRLSFEIPSMF